ncbi:hypothetical protein Tco_1538810, partial [Tanacetum coccineum]
SEENVVVIFTKGLSVVDQKKICDLLNYSSKRMDVEGCIMKEFKESEGSGCQSHKDASIEDIMSLLCLESPLADVPGMGDLQPDINASHSRVERIKANIVAERSALLGVWTPLSEPLSVQNLIGEASTFANVPAATVTTTTLSTTFASASSILPITIDDYEIVHADSQESSQGNVQGDAATVEFEKEDLDTTPEHDLLN